MKQADLIFRLCPYKDGDAVFEARALLTWYDSIGTRYIINPCEGIYNANNRIAGENNADTENNYSLSKDAKEALISLYPNPAKGQLHVYYQGVQHLQQIEIYDLSGRKVFAQDFIQIEKLQMYSLDISHLENGTYISTVWAGGELLHTEKIVLIK